MTVFMTLAFSQNILIENVDIACATGAEALPRVDFDRMRFPANALRSTHEDLTAESVTVKTLLIAEKN